MRIQALESGFFKVFFSRNVFEFLLLFAQLNIYYYILRKLLKMPTRFVKIDMTLRRIQVSSLGALQTRTSTYISPLILGTCEHLCPKYVQLLVFCMFIAREVHFTDILRRRNQRIKQTLKFRSKLFNRYRGPNLASGTASPGSILFKLLQNTCKLILRKSISFKMSLKVTI